jgi:hypothetical protein
VYPRHLRSIFLFTIIHVYWIATISNMIFYYMYQRGKFDSRSGQTKQYKIGMFCFSAKQATFVRSKDCSVRIMCMSISMSTCGMLFQWARQYKNGIIWSSTKQTSSSSCHNATCFSYDMTEKIAQLALNNSH